MRARLFTFAVLTFAGSFALASIAGCSGGNTNGTLATSNPADAAATAVEDGGSGITATSDGGTSTSSTGTSSNGALKIVNLTTTTATLTGGNALSTEPSSVTFVAIVTDAKGLDNIAGGTLVDDTGTTYGSFGTGSTKGTYSSSLSWQQINQGRALDFMLGDAAAKRKFVAKFFDNDGNVAEAPLTIAFQCRTDEKTLMGACGRACVDSLTTGDHCGGCATHCDKGKACSNSACAALTLDTYKWTSCAPRHAFAADTTCADVCKEAGSTCASGGYFNKTASCSGGQDDVFHPGCSEPVTSSEYANGPYLQCACK